MTVRKWRHSWILGLCVCVCVCSSSSLYWTLQGDGVCYAAWMVNVWALLGKSWLNLIAAAQGSQCSAVFPTRFREVKQVADWSQVTQGLSATVGHGRWLSCFFYKLVTECTTLLPLTGYMTLGLTSLYFSFICWKMVGRNTWSKVVVRNERDKRMYGA